MLVRLTDDGKVRWDKRVGEKWEQQVTSLTARRMSEIKQSLDAIDQSGLRAKMGPYYRYVDTSAELRIRMTTSHGGLTFSVLNPWRGDLTSVLIWRPIPKNVKIVVCEVSRLRAQVAREPVDPQCESSNMSQ